jgi:hypothetical protein
MIIASLCALSIFWILYFKKYDENFIEKISLIYFHLFNLFIFKLLIYQILFLILKNLIKDESPGKIFIWFLAIKNAFLVYCTVYLYKRNGLISYVTLTIFGILAVETLKFRGMKIAKPVRGGGAIGAGMNLFDRFARVVKVKEITL